MGHVGGTSPRYVDDPPRDPGHTPIGETFSYAGTVHSVTDSPGLPKPNQQPLPIIIGGGGPRRTPALSARYATEYNVAFHPLQAFVERKYRVEAACAAINRAGPMRYSLGITTCAGPTEAEVARRAASIGRETADLRENGAAGSAEEVAAKLRTFVDAGAERIYVQILDLSDLDHLDFIANEVAPLLA